MDPWLTIGYYGRTARLSRVGALNLPADIDVWVGRDGDNARRIVTALRSFGFDVPSLTKALFLEPDRITRMGVAPLRGERRERDQSRRSRQRTLGW